ncbi:hypothetical protein HPP92_002266 [Vanilla planifolia]|uniref:Uncharacterized protein n=1 Tax=Vanilla planifolia TaxID=51239 RepID=A0A835VHV2_VANPL|nr:hypothetical protein HPP92_002266 [Vanilla planifolia]
MAFHLPFALILAFAAISHITATDPNQLQDFCVSDNSSNLFINGLVCKNSKQVTENDFFFQGINVPGNTSNRIGSKVTAVNAGNLLG